MNMMEDDSLKYLQFGQNQGMMKDQKCFKEAE